MSTQNAGKRPATDSSSNPTNKKSKFLNGQPVLSERAMLMAERRQKIEDEKNERKRVQAEENKRVSAEKAAARLVRQSAQKRKREQRDQERRAKQAIIDEAKAAKRAIIAAKALKKKLEQQNLKAKAKEERAKIKAETSNNIKKARSEREIKIQLKLAEEEAKRKMRAGLTSAALAKRDNRKAEANRIRKIQENARFDREQFEVTYKAIYPIEDSSITEDETIHPALPTPLPPKPVPKGCLLGPLSTSWERGTLIACYDVLYLFGPYLQLTPRFGVHDLHDGLACNETECELVTSVVCALLKVILPESINMNADDEDENEKNNGDNNETDSSSSSSSTSSTSSTASSSISNSSTDKNYIEHELFGRNAPGAALVTPTTYSEILRMIFRRHSGVTLGAGLPKNAEKGIRSALVLMDRGTVFYKLDVISKLCILLGLIQLLKGGKSFKSWVDEHLERGIIVKKKVNGELFKKKRLRTALREKKKTDEKKAREKKRKLELRKKKQSEAAANGQAGVGVEVGVGGEGGETGEGGEGGEGGVGGKANGDNNDVTMTDGTSMKTGDKEDKEDKDDKEEEEGNGQDNDIQMTNATNEGNDSSSSSSSSSSSAAPVKELPPPPPAVHQEGECLECYAGSGKLIKHLGGHKKEPPVVKTKSGHKRGRTGPILIMGLREIPMPKDEEPEEVSDDEIAPDEDATMERIQLIRLRKMRGLIKKKNAIKIQRRKEREIKLVKMIEMKEKRKEVCKDILEALDYENLNDLEDAMKEAAKLGLEGKNGLKGDNAGAWRCRELKEAYRLKSGIESKKKNQDRLRAVRAKKDKLAQEEREYRREEWYEREHQMSKWRVNADLIGKDRYCNRYWIFSWHSDVVYLENINVTSTNTTRYSSTTSTSSKSERAVEAMSCWNFYTKDQIIELHASLDYRGERENKLRDNLNLHFFDLIESMRARHWVFDSFQLDEVHQSEGWVKQGHALIGRSVRRVYEDGNTFVDGRIMAYWSKTNGKKNDFDQWIMLHKNEEMEYLSLEEVEESMMCLEKGIFTSDQLVEQLKKQAKSNKSSSKSSVTSSSSSTSSLSSASSEPHWNKDGHSFIGLRTCVLIERIEKQSKRKKSKKKKNSKYDSADDSAAVAAANLAASASNRTTSTGGANSEVSRVFDETTGNTTITDTRCGTIIGWSATGSATKGSNTTQQGPYFLIQGDDGQTTEMSKLETENAKNQHVTTSLHIRYKNTASIWNEYTSHLNGETGHQGCLKEMTRTLNSCVLYEGPKAKSTESGASWTTKTLKDIGWQIGAVTQTVEEGKNKFLQLLEISTRPKDLIQPLLDLEFALRSTQENEDDDDNNTNSTHPNNKKDEDDEEEEEEDLEDDEDEEDNNSSKSGKKSKKRKKPKKKSNAAVAAAVAVAAEEKAAKDDNEDQDGDGSQTSKTSVTVSTGPTEDELAEYEKDMVPSLTLWPSGQARLKWIQYVQRSKTFHQISLANMALWDRAVVFERAGTNDTAKDWIHFSRNWGF